MNEEFKWYVIHTFSGYENKVRADIEKAMDGYGENGFVQDIKIPIEEVTEVKEGKKKSRIKKVFPGYVFIKMIMNDENWHIIRSCRGVTGFVGSSPKPLPLSEKEVLEIGFNKKTNVLNFEVGDSIVVKDGVLEGFVGVIESINNSKSKVRAKISMFGRDTEVDLDFEQIGSLV